MDEELAVLEQLTLSDLKKWSSTARTLKFVIIFGNWKPFEMMKNAFYLFHLKSSSRSQDI